MLPSTFQRTDGCELIDDVGATLAAIATSYDCGSMGRIISKTLLGMEWEDANGSSWFMQPSSVACLLQNWNGESAINWFFDATLANGEDVRAVTFVSPQKMAEIRSLFA